MRRALLVVSSATRLGDFSVAASIPASPLASAFYTLTDAGASVDIASVSGGAVTLDWGGVVSTDAAARRLASDGAARAALSSPLALPAVGGAAYAVIFVTPSLATAWDCSHNAELARVLRECHGAGGVVAGSGDGVRALLPLLPPGARATAPPKADVDADGAAALVPWLVETRFKEAGCVWVPPRARDAPLAMTAGRVVTGANDASAALVAQEAVAALTGGVVAGAV